MRSLGPPHAHLRVLTFKDGLLSAVAHDLEIDVTRFSINLADDGVRVEVDTTSLHARHAMKDGAPAPGLLSRRDLRKIDDNILRDVLRTNRFPSATFTADVPADDATSLRGRLSLCGRERDVELALTRDDTHLHLRARLHQPDFGITPYTAMMGTLRIRPHVDVHADLPLDALREGR